MIDCNFFENQDRRILSFATFENRCDSGWLWSPRTGDIAQTRRAASAETFRRLENVGTCLLCCFILFDNS